MTIVTSRDCNSWQLLLVVTVILDNQISTTVNYTYDKLNLKVYQPLKWHYAPFMVNNMCKIKRWTTLV